MTRTLTDYFNWLAQIEKECEHYNPDALYKVRTDVARNLYKLQDDRREIELLFESWGLNLPDLSQFDVVIQKTGKVMAKLNRLANKERLLPV